MQVFNNKEKIGALTKTGNTTVQLSPSVITIGAKQYTTSYLTCDTSISGAGGLDTGGVQANSTYYVYAVVDAGVVKLIASLSSVSPLGFLVSNRIGGLLADYLTYIEQVSKVRLEPKNSFSAKITNNGVASIASQGGSNFISNVTRTNVGRVLITFHAGFFLESPAIQTTATIPTGDYWTANAYAISTIGCTTFLWQYSPFGLEDREHDIFVERQGADIREPIDLIG